MKLQEICDNLHFNALKPGDTVECISPTKGSIFNLKEGEFYEITSKNSDFKEVFIKGFGKFSFFPTRFKKVG
jgi:hypothetical protein